ncbi:autotransporter assembly complex family protein [Sphingomonas sp. SUN039]|uniref:autotransporter assembly complex protein TamA n=1 Tax=Sphingomonas sp. SUN039 TaxID=2937787 RepID=UPI0021646AA3|nr:BamA/TamA family outer membrane protein [Sphingomonas sp. SUN039]UVO54333.1 BamA/TamA family outer membrane protein [Sphingomonas sp. SUN039]
MGSGLKYSAVFALAVLCSGAARAQPATPPAPPPVSTPGDLDPETPLAPLPGLGVDWPDLNTRDALEAAPDTAVARPDETPRYSVQLLGVDDIPKARERFDSLSVLRQNDGKPANVAQIDRRARDDAELLDAIMRSEGYYDATITTDIVPATDGGRVTVKLTVTPGEQFKFTDVEVKGVDATGQKPALETAFGVAPAKPVVAEDVIAGQAALLEKLGRTGYPFAKVGEPSVVVDHETRGATLDLNVDPGGKRNFGAIRYDGGKPPFNAKHAEVIARWDPGDLYDSYLVDDFRRALVATGLVSQVRVTPVEGTTPGTVDMQTTLDPAPFRTIAGEAGYGTGEGFRVEASWQHRNLIQPEGAVTLRGIVGTREQLLGATLRMGNFKRRDQVLNARLLASHEDKISYDAYTVELAGNLERQTTIIWQKPWSYSFGGEVLYSSERNFDPLRGALIRRNFYIGALPVTLSYDGSDDLLDPKRGGRLSARISPEVSLESKTFGYVKVQLDGSYYQPVGKRVVIAGRARLGGIAGASQSTIAPSRLFYAGGGGSVRGFGYQQIGPLNALNQPTGGRSLAEFSLEARVRLPMFGGNFGVVPFIDAGNVYEKSLPSFSDLRVGVGVGLRYYSNFGPIRIDVGTPLSRRPNESRISIQVSLGQAF